MKSANEYLAQQQHFADMYRGMTKEEMIQELAALHCFFNYVMDKLGDLDERTVRLERKTPMDDLREWYDSI